MTDPDSTSVLIISRNTIHVPIPAVLASNDPHLKKEHLSPNGIAPPWVPSNPPVVQAPSNQNVPPYFPATKHFSNSVPPHYPRPQQTAHTPATPPPFGALQASQTPANAPHTSPAAAQQPLINLPTPSASYQPTHRYYSVTSFDNKGDNPPFRLSHSTWDSANVNAVPPPANATLSWTID